LYKSNVESLVENRTARGLRIAELCCWANALPRFLHPTLQRHLQR